MIIKIYLVLWVSLLAVNAIGFDCPGDGLFSDPENCHCFYDCANGLAFNECCGSGTMWSDDLMTCDYTDHVDCGDRPYPDGSTSPQPPSTTEETTLTENTTTTERTTAEEKTTTTEKVPTTSSSGYHSSTTTTKTPETTTSSHAGGSHELPSKVLGMYVLLSDDTEDGYHTEEDGWEPKLYPYQQQGANVLFFTFINPETMAVPESFKKLAATRGSDAEGAVPSNTRILFAIGGYAYSLAPNPWAWLTSREAAEAMAEEVATWRELYNIDGIDLDIEAGAGDKQEAGPNMLHFIRKLKSIHPDMIVSQPTYGYPQVQAEIDVVNGGWTVDGENRGLLESVGLMVYEGTQSLNYVDNYAHGTSQWEGFPITVDVTISDIMLGCKGSARSGDIMTLAGEAIAQDLRGVMVWYCSVEGGLKYEESWDCSGSEESMEAYILAMQHLNDASR